MSDEMARAEGLRASVGQFITMLVSAPGREGGGHRVRSSPTNRPGPGISAVTSVAGRKKTLRFDETLIQHRSDYDALIEF